MHAFALVPLYVAVVPSILFDKSAVGEISKHRRDLEILQPAYCIASYNGRAEGTAIDGMARIIMGGSKLLAVPNGRRWNLDLADITQNLEMGKSSSPKCELWACTRCAGTAPCFMETGVPGRWARQVSY